MLFASRSEIHSRFRQNRTLEPAQAETEIQQALEVARILRENIVQGRQVEGEGNGDLYSE